MRDEFTNNKNDNDEKKDNQYNENNMGEGTVNFEIVDSTAKEIESTEPPKADYDFWNSKAESNFRNYSGNSSQAQYKAADYGYQSGQNTAQKENYDSYGQQNSYYNGQSPYTNGNYGNADYSNSSYNNGSNYNNSSNSYDENKGDGKKKKDSFGKKLVKTAALAAVFGLVAGVVFQGVNVVSSKFLGTETNTTLEENKDVEITNTPQLPVSSGVGAQGVTDVSDLVENTMPAMVAITSTIVEDYRYFGHTFSQEAEGSGSGIIVGKNDNQLLIVTNNHVIDGAKTISVCFVDKEIVQADVKGTDPSSDLAVVAIDMEDIKDETKALIKVATLGDSDEVKLGQMAVAIGNALGYGQSVTVGYISAKDRTITAGTGNSATTMNLIQTDAAINPGNSGGALLNMKGEVIGINSAKLADTDVEGMGYAIPITYAVPIINELMNREVLKESEKGYLGITGQDITEENNIYNMPTGVYVYEVAEEGAAKEAGMQQGDIIVKINGADVKNMEAVQNKVNNTRVGTKITVSVMRNVNGSYEEIELEVTLKGYDSLNSIRTENNVPNQQEQDYDRSQNEYPDNGREYYYGDEDASDFFQEFFGDFGF